MLYTGDYISGMLRSIGIAVYFLKLNTDIGIAAAINDLIFIFNHPVHVIV